MEKLFAAGIADELAEVLKGDEELAKLSRGLTVRVALVLKKDGSAASPALVLAFVNGQVQKPQVTDASTLGEADYEFQASPGVWQDLLQGELDPVWAATSGKLKVARGNFLSLATLLPTFRRLLELAQKTVAALG